MGGWGKATPITHEILVLMVGALSYGDGFTEPQDISLRSMTSFSWSLAAK